MIHVQFTPMIIPVLFDAFVIFISFICEWKFARSRHPRESTNISITFFRIQFFCGVIEVYIYEVKKFLISNISQKKYEIPVVGGVENEVVRFGQTVVVVRIGDCGIQFSSFPPGIQCPHV